MTVYLLLLHVRYFKSYSLTTKMKSVLLKFRQSLKTFPQPEDFNWTVLGIELRLKLEAEAEAEPSLAH